MDNKGKDSKYPSVVEGLKRIYEKRIKPIEVLYQFENFYSPLLKDSDFDAKPTVLLLGQYSTGKTTFLKYLLDSDYPGSHIGPEPTTDRFVAVMHGTEELVTPGHALVVDSDKPFRALSKFGTNFLNKFQSSQMPNSFLEDITFVDSPGVLSGEKQRINRGYDFVGCVEWFVERSDLVILLFDAHKLDISDEFKRTIETLRGHEDKVRVVLNKADMVSPQQLMRVYGALMWALGKVLLTPEVVRVYIGSFWDKPYQNDENSKLFEAEKADLFKDLRTLPRTSALRKINELVKRARLAKVHAYLVSYLKDQMPSVFGKGKKQDKLICSLEEAFTAVSRKYRLSPGDFPNIEKFRDRLKILDFSKFPKLNVKTVAKMDHAMALDIPELMKMFPNENLPPINPFDTNLPIEDMDDIIGEDRQKYGEMFDKLEPVDGKISAKKAKSAMMSSNLSQNILAKVWSLSDRDKDGQLTKDEFAIAMHLINQSISGTPLPNTLPRSLQTSMSPINNRDEESRSSVTPPPSFDGAAKLRSLIIRKGSRRTKSGVL